MKPPFERTTCACTDCVACCKRKPGPLVPGDLRRIADYLGQTTAAVLQTYLVASPGATVLGLVTGLVRRVGSITPARKPDGSCVFLDPDDRCSIHEVAPAGCAYFDTHMGLAEANVRSTWMVKETTDAGYQEMRRHLRHIGREEG